MGQTIQGFGIGRLAGTPGNEPQPAVQQGRWQGRQVSWSPSTQATQAAQHAAAQAQGPQLQDAQIRTLADRQARADLPVRQFTTAQIAAHARDLVADPLGVRRMARDVLRGQPPDAAAGRRAITTRYLALQMARNVLEENTSDADLVAVLTPIKRQPANAQEFAQILQTIGDDPDEVRDLMTEVLDDQRPEDEELPTEAEELFFLLRRLRHDPLALMDRLGRAQGIPPGQAQRAALRQQIEDELREMETSSQGSLILASLNAAEVASATAQPSQFLDVYAQLVAQPQGWCGTLKLFLNAWSIEQLGGAVRDMMRALADDLAAATPSRDPRRLHAVVSELSNLKLSSTLIEMVDELVGLIVRTSHEQPAR